MIDILYTRFATPFPQEVLENCLLTMPAFIREKIQRYHRWEDRQAGLLGKLLLREALTWYGYGPDYLSRLQTDGYGRPRVGDSLDFNISHSGEFVVCVITAVGRVGVDIERIRDMDISGFHRYFLQESWQEISASVNDLRCFFDHWTMRESVIKADGRGLSVPLKELNVKEEKVVLDSKVWHLKKVELSSSYCCHLATDIENPELHILAPAQIPFLSRE
ncbi:MAG: 4'-phosphopantetheinyl transferase superfamily protein [Syntrophales bacterium]|nr:4'-phosphopantetheinyl transferase superfamily protein [Syntrophales bacterium]